MGEHGGYEHKGGRKFRLCVLIRIEISLLHSKAVTQFIWPFNHLKKNVGSTLFNTFVQPSENNGGK